MPGIVGLITKMPRKNAEPRLLRMVEALRHESFYKSGTWIDEDQGVYVGWVARNGSFAEGMPLTNETGNTVLIFSGEEFPDPQTRATLRGQGHSFDAKGPAYLVHLAEEHSFPEKLNGRFHGLLVDRTRNQTTLFNDRYGMHRIYWHQSRDAFYFAAEAKAILAVCPELRKLDEQGLGEFISCGCVLQNRTIFQGIGALPGASSWVFRSGVLESKKTYFDPKEWEQQTVVDDETYYQELREVFSRNLPRYFETDERMGLSLTGGLDTRMIMAWNKPSPGSLPCYSFGGVYRDSQDVIVARRVAETLEQPYEVISVGKDFLSRFAHYAERTVYLTDGCVEVSRSADLYVNEKAREIAPVRLTGNYGGEVLRAIRAFKPVEPIKGLFRPELLSHVDVARKTYDEVIKGHPVSFAVFRQAPWHHYGLLALEQTQLSLRSPYLDNELVRTVFRSPSSARATSDPCLRLISDGNSVLRKLRTDRGLAGNGGRLSATISRNVLEFTFKAEYAYDYGMPQWVARTDHLLSRFHLERLFLGRHKFYHFRVWYRDALSSYVREMLLDPRSLSRSYIEPKALGSMVEGHLKGTQNYTTEIHKVLTLELLHRLFLDSQ